MSTYISTYTGRHFHPLDPQVDEIHIEDIAHALSLLCRFTGHCRTFYSVAQHSVHVSYACNREDALWGLLHDASEAYLVDVATPVKQAEEMKGYRTLECRLMTCLCNRFRLHWRMPESVKQADQQMLNVEVEQLMRNFPKVYDVPPLDLVITPQTPQEAEYLFLRRFKELTPTTLFQQ